ncbi:MAG: BlaI/MecI/CopY family transcriptional regulator, partial [Acidimicrobiales bacterium]
MTVMNRLFEKGLLSRSEQRRPYTYWRAVSREDYSAGLMLDVLAELRDRRAVLARFVERIGPRDAEVLRQLVEGKRRRGR